LLRSYLLQATAARPFDATARQFSISDNLLQQSVHRRNRFLPRCQYAAQIVLGRFQGGSLGLVVRAKGRNLRLQLVFGRFVIDGLLQRVNGRIGFTEKTTPLPPLSLSISVVVPTVSATATAPASASGPPSAKACHFDAHQVPAGVKNFSYFRFDGLPFRVICDAHLIPQPVHHALPHFRRIKIAATLRVKFSPAQNQSGAAAADYQYFL
jgi:hypothetical protein